MTWAAGQVERREFKGAITRSGNRCGKRRSQVGVVRKGDLAGVQAAPGADRRNLVAKHFELDRNSSSARNPWITTLISEPPGEHLDQDAHVAPVGMNVLTGNVGYVSLIAIALSVEHDASLGFLGPGAETSSAEKNAQFQRMLKRGRLVAGSTSVREMS